MSLSIPDILQLLNSRATTWYGQEAVSQLEHALQCAQLAENAGESDNTVVAALLHDLGHMLGHNQAIVEDADPDAQAEKDDLVKIVQKSFSVSFFSLFPSSLNNLLFFSEE